MIPKIADFLNILIQTPLTKGFYYLLFFLFILDLLSILWLIYWFYEYQNTSPGKPLITLARALLLLELISVFFATGGYLIMIALNTSIPPLVGLIFEIISFSVLIIILILLFLFIIYKHKSEKSIIVTNEV